MQHFFKDAAGSLPLAGFIDCDFSKVLQHCESENESKIRWNSASMVAFLLGKCINFFLLINCVLKTKAF